MASSTYVLFSEVLYIRKTAIVCFLIFFDFQKPRFLKKNCSSENPKKLSYIFYPQNLALYKF